MCLLDERHQKIRWMRRLRGVWQYLQIGHIFGHNRCLARFLLQELKRDALIKSIIWQAKNDDYEASDSVLQSGHLFGSTVVQREFYTNSSKVSLWR